LFDTRAVSLLNGLHIVAAEAAVTIPLEIEKTFLRRMGRLTVEGQSG
jgi:hypothetical protein